MKKFVCFLIMTFSLVLPSIGWTSDHADPMSLNVLVPQDAPIANITDLHAWVVNKKGERIKSMEQISEGDQLMVSLCVRRRLLHWQIKDPVLKNDLPEVSFRLHFDFDPRVKHFDPNRFSDGQNAVEGRKKLDMLVDEAQLRLDDAIKEAMKKATATADKISDVVDKDPKVVEAQAQLQSAQKSRNSILIDRQVAERMEALYGGTIDTPESIAEDAVLDFRLKLDYVDEDKNATVSINRCTLSGLHANIHFLPSDKYHLEDSSVVPGNNPPPAFRSNAINIQTGIFDDPFIFPRFFRGNVIGIVTSIPLNLLKRPDGSNAADGTILIWATTNDKKGMQSDHVGRSLRTQLPRFGYLNALHPSEHVAAVLRRHTHPTLLENSLATFLAPLEAHRFYDATPDVMVYDLTKPAKFPNGRWLEDDVAQVLADAGETLLLELSMSESKQFPRATVNDKPFRTSFPYLAEPWSKQESAKYALVGAKTADGIVLPNAPDPDATALPDFLPEVWVGIWRGLLIGLLIAGGLAFLLLEGTPARIAIVLIAITALCYLSPILADPLMPTDPGFMQQPYQKLLRMIYGIGIIAMLGAIALFAAGIRRGKALAAAAPPSSIPGEAEEGLDDADRQYQGSSYTEVHDAVFKDGYHGGNPRDGLNYYPVPVRTLVTGLLFRWLPAPFRDASSRTLESHADLRWGKDGKGVRRLLHPHGVCLAGEWRITYENEYSGLFRNGTICPIIARYSSEQPLNTLPRGLSLTGKLFPVTVGQCDEKVKTATFFAQSVLGGIRVSSVFDPNLELRNAPDVRPFATFRAFIGLAISKVVFSLFDTHVTERQLYEIAEAGLSPEDIAAGIKVPRFLRLKIKSPTPVGATNTPDFREEILTQVNQIGIDGNPGKLVFGIEVSDVGRISGWINQTLVDAKWKELGEIVFTEAVVSHNGDFVIHFHHPKWRDSLNTSS